MTTEIEKKAADVGAPFSDGTNSNIRLFTMNTTHLSNALPAAWAGKVRGCDPRSAATFGSPFHPWGYSRKSIVRLRQRLQGQGPKVVARSPVRETRPFRVPQHQKMDQTDAIYFNRESDVATAAVRRDLLERLGDQT